MSPLLRVWNVFIGTALAYMIIFVPWPQYVGWHTFFDILGLIIASANLYEGFTGKYLLAPNNGG